MSGVVIPTMRYRNSVEAVEFLCEAFGFEKRLVVPAEDGTIAHSQLQIGNGMIMVGQDREDEFGRLQRAPEAGRPVTQSAYIIVPDADAVYERAKAAGATIVYEIRDEDYGGRGFSCKDPEGHLWNFGTYDPWADQ